MRIVFLGNNDFSTTVLDALVGSQHQLVGVVCSLDKPTGRGQKVEMCAVKKYALAHNIPVLQYKSVSREGEADVRALNPDVLITASFGQMLRENILTLAPHGVINVHGSLLPALRGATPVQTALFLGLDRTGVTIMQTDIGMDTGDILYQREIPIYATDTSVELFDRMAKTGADCLITVLGDLDHYIKARRHQDNAKATTTSLIKDSKIDFNLPNDQIVNFIRGNYPYSTAYCTFRGEKFKVGFAQTVDSDRNGNAGEIVNANKFGLIVACGKGHIELVRVQPANKKMMPARDFINGAHIEIGEKFE